MKYKYKQHLVLAACLLILQTNDISAQKKTKAAIATPSKKPLAGKPVSDTVKLSKVRDTIIVDSSAIGNAPIPAPAVTVVDSSLLDRITALEQQVADQKPGDDHFMMVGLATVGFISSKVTNTIGGVSLISKTNSLPDAGRFEFSPMFLWRHGKKFLLEFEPSFNNGGLSVNWADISYFAAPGLIIRAGYLVLPFGYYNKHLAAGWIGKLATDPIGIGLPPSSDYGVEAEGGFPLGNMKWNYDVAVTNGMQLQPDGQLQNAGITDNNTNKTFSGRVGLLPFSNSSLEIGASALYGKVGDAVSKFQNAKADMYAFDINYVKSFKPVLVNIKGQYNMININKQNFVNPGDSTQTYSFDNKTRSTYAQISIRPTLAKNTVVKNFELAFRYADFKSPLNSLFGEKTDQYDLGLAYWVSWRSVLKLTHETLSSNSRINTVVGTDGGKTITNSWILQFSIQL